MKLRGKKINEYVKDINVNDSVPKNKIKHYALTFSKLHIKKDKTLNRKSMTIFAF